MTTTHLTIALAGNPNCGKTTIFNNITGARQHVGNYPGVTVEKREGMHHYQGQDLLFIDLPGTYSLTANSLDELVARNVIINDKPDLLVNILDAANLERNLYLAAQLLELERPMVLALNMTDVAEKRGLTINDQLLKEKLGVEVVRTVGNRNRGTEYLLQTVTAAAIEKRQPFALDYGLELEEAIATLSQALANISEIKYPLRWLAVKLLENDPGVQESLQNISGSKKVLALAQTARQSLQHTFDEEPEIIIASKRYQFAGALYREIATEEQALQETSSDKIDRVLTHRVWGLPIFFGIMWLLFNIVFTVGDVPKEWLEQGVKALGSYVGQQLAEGDLRSLLVDGIIGGVGSVIVFLPNILLLFAGIALLEDTGYMARAAFVIDRVMRAVGLHGKSFIPLLLGFGCNVPAIMGTRTLENPRERMVTILVAPLMSCSARLPVYTLLTAAFFSQEIAGTVLFSIYLLGIALAITMALVFRKLLFTGSTETFIMEMPPYHLPTLRSILMHMWERSVLYLKKAGTLILVASILVWFATNYPKEVVYSQDFDQAKETIAETFNQQVQASILQPLNIEEGDDAATEAITALAASIDEVLDGKLAADTAENEEITAALTELQETSPELFNYAMLYYEYQQTQKTAEENLKRQEASEKLAGSYAGQFGKAIEPAIKPLGFDWKMGVGLVSAVAAKEVMVSTLGTIYNVGEIDEDDSSSLQSALAADPAFTPLVAYCLMVFTLIYSPCLAALAVLRRETNSWKWTAFSFVYSTVLAWVVTFLVYQAGTALLS